MRVPRVHYPLLFYTVYTLGLIRSAGTYPGADLATTRYRSRGGTWEGLRCIIVHRTNLPEAAGGTIGDPYLCGVRMCELHLQSLRHTISDSKSLARQTLSTASRNLIYILTS